jgi:hypothetical protein
MSLRELLILYGVVGVACAIAVLRKAPSTRARAVSSAVATVFVWPLWAPFALGAAPARASRPETSPADRAAVQRIERALSQAVDAVAGTPMSEVFSPKIAQRIAAEVARVAARLDELGELTSRAGFDAEASAKHLRDLEARGAPERTVVSARLQHESLTRLKQLGANDAEALEELAELLEALRAQLLLARYSGSSAEGAGAIVSEVWARLEGLGVAFDVPAEGTVYARRG